MFLMFSTLSLPWKVSNFQRANGSINEMTGVSGIRSVIHSIILIFYGLFNNAVSSYSCSIQRQVVWRSRRNVERSSGVPVGKISRQFAWSD
jgi:hypothetical protein